MDWFQAFGPPTLLAIVVIWLMRELRADFRDLKADMESFRKGFAEEFRTLSNENRALGRELSELKGSLRPINRDQSK